FTHWCSTSQCSPNIVQSGSERQTYLEHVVAGVKRVIENPEKLTEQPAFHEFCRMVSRLKTNFQLCELIKVPDYAAVMRLLAQFTVESLRDIRVVIAEGSLYVFGKTAVSNNEEHDKMDGDLVARCLKFMRISDNRLIFPTTVNANPGKELLSRAYGQETQWVMDGLTEGVDSAGTRHPPQLFDRNSEY
ncbi:hypothetical protein OSTOST_24785, partial [Ostertagia ostertagi]